MRCRVVRDNMISIEPESDADDVLLRKWGSMTACMSGATSGLSDKGWGMINVTVSFSPRSQGNQPTATNGAGADTIFGCFSRKAEGSEMKWLTKEVNRFITENEERGYSVVSQSSHMAQGGDNSLIAPTVVICVWMEKVENRLSVTNRSGYVWSENHQAYVLAEYVERGDSWSDHVRG